MTAQASGRFATDADLPEDVRARLVKAKLAMASMTPAMREMLKKAQVLQKMHLT